MIRRLRHALRRLFTCSRHGHDLIVRRRADWIGQARCVRCGGLFAVLLQRPHAPPMRWTRRMDAPFAVLEADFDEQQKAGFRAWWAQQQLRERTWN